ncbi:MAG: squalene/phytoene synthase family protein [Magnetococcales bacterium]|nr:squalene/phytoene synthase family protein [Magnetococcales bacterium]
MAMDTKPFDRCFQIAAQNQSPLFQVSRLFPQAKRRLFLAAYAAMRLVDDLVDEHDQDTGSQDPNMAALLHSRVERWQAQACDAANGAFQSSADAYEPLVFTALDHTVGRSNLGEWPWRALADAMRADIEKRPLKTWDDFLAYSEGATVAPAAVFAYILACRFRDGRYTTPESIDFYREKVRDMAIFCYLIHILRDLAHDVARSPQLVTIPEDILRDAGLDKALLAQWIHTEPQRIAPLRRLLLDQAKACRDRGMDPLMRDISLPFLERQILKKLVHHYTSHCDEMLAHSAKE